MGTVKPPCAGLAAGDISSSGLTLMAQQPAQVMGLEQHSGWDGLAWAGCHGVG